MHPSRVLRRAPVALLVVLALACEHITDPPFPAGTVGFVAPANYALWWGEMESCSVVSRDFSDVKWFVVPGVSDFLLDGVRVSGYWSSHSNQIVLAELSLKDGAVVRHEMLHSLVRRSGHPIEYFRDRCGGFVACLKSCADEAGLPSDVPAGAPTISATELVVGVETIPSSPSASQFAGVTTFVVSARNPRTVPVQVALVASPGFGGFRSTFGYAIGNGPVRESHITGDGRIGFAAGETKRFAFDTFTKLSGTITVRGWFNADTATTTVIVRP